MIFYLDDDFNPVEKEQATMAKVIPDDINDPPYFITFDKTRDFLAEIESE